MQNVMKHHHFWVLYLLLVIFCYQRNVKKSLKLLLCISCVYIVSQKIFSYSNKNILIPSNLVTTINYDINSKVRRCSELHLTSYALQTFVKINFETYDLRLLFWNDFSLCQPFKKILSINYIFLISHTEVFLKNYMAQNLPFNTTTFEWLDL